MMTEAGHDSCHMSQRTYHSTHDLLCFVADCVEDCTSFIDETSVRTGIHHTHMRHVITNVRWHLSVDSDRISSQPIQTICIDYEGERRGDETKIIASSLIELWVITSGSEIDRKIVFASSMSLTLP
jgi:hypothetical protein